jgi:hypothetical protein
VAKIVPIVEGPGEVAAVPVLINGILRSLGEHTVFVAAPKNAHGKGNLTKPGGLERFVELAELERDCGAVLILVDSDDECPVELARAFVGRLQQRGVARPTVVVCAARAYETWLIAGNDEVVRKIASAHPSVERAIDDVDSIRGPKGKIDATFPSGTAYRETIDQESMTRSLDLDLALQRSRSFRRLHTAIQEALAGIASAHRNITPAIPSPAPPPASSNRRRRRRSP